MVTVTRESYDGVLVETGKQKGLESGYRKYFNTSCQWRKTGGGLTYPGSKESGTWTSTSSSCIYSDLFPGWRVANEIAKPQVCINFNNSSIDCQKTATRNVNLQPEIESNECSSCKKITRVLAAALITAKMKSIGIIDSPSTRLPHVDDKKSPKTCKNSPKFLFPHFFKADSQVVLKRHQSPYLKAVKRSPIWRHFAQSGNADLWRGVPNWQLCAVMSQHTVNPQCPAVLV